jgi:hypothetical protein
LLDDEFHGVRALGRELPSLDQSAARERLDTPMSDAA